MRPEPTTPDAFPRNVFVLCTGRCGSTTLVEACGHLSNWTSGHETRTHLLGPARLAYPDGHIEADNRLSWLLGRLDEAFGDRAAYVHLTRDPEAVSPNDTLAFALGKMDAGGYRHLPVVSGGRPIGVISVRDILRHVTLLCRKG